MSRVIFHIDVNSAFLSWTAVDKLRQGLNIDLRDIPSAIGGDEKSRKGVILAKSIYAKEYGVVTGESIYSAKKKCPNLTIVKPNFLVYEKSSENMMKILKEYSPIMQKFSIDECFLEFRDLDYKKQEPIKLAEEISRRIKKELGFTVNIGISTNKLLAKMASDFAKPNRIHTLYENEIKNKMWTLTVDKLYMVGKKSVPRLRNLNIFTIGDLANYDKNILKEKFKSYGILIWNYANGIDNSKVEEQLAEYKGISNSITLAEDIINKEEAYEILNKLANSVCERLRRMNKFAYSVSISIRNNNFDNYSHGKKMDVAINSTMAVKKIVNSLFDEIWRGDAIRLLGVSLTQLVEDQIKQISLFELNDESIIKQEKLDNTIDYINNKYGKTYLRRSIKK